MLLRQNIELKQLKEEGVCFGSQCEGTILHDGEALAAGTKASGSIVSNLGSREH